MVSNGRSERWEPTKRDADLLDRVEEAEEEGPDDGEDSGGVPVEPFHLKEERKRGYFDEEAGYVERKRGKRGEEEGREDDEEEDEWLKTLGVAEGIEEEESEQDEPIAEEDVEVVQAEKIKAEMISRMQPGESVTRSIQRLGKERKETKSIQSKEGIDFLTERASRLLEMGEYDIYSKTREAILRDCGPQLLMERENKVEETFEEDMFAEDQGG